MSDKKSAADGAGEPWRDLLRLQQQLVARGAEFVESLGQLVGEGSLEPREYLERSTKLWADMIGEVGDWIRPQSNAPSGLAGLHLIRQRVERRVRSQPILLEIPDGLFDGAARDARFLLSVDGFARRQATRTSLRPTLGILPDTHFRLQPQEVSRPTRRRVELKIFDLPDNLVSGDVYDGILWAELIQGAGQNGVEQPAGEQPEPKVEMRKPIAFVELTIG